MGGEVSLVVENVFFLKIKSPHRDRGGGRKKYMFLLNFIVVNFKTYFNFAYVLWWF